MNTKKFSYLLLPLFLNMALPVFASDEPIIIADTDANVVVEPQSESSLSKTEQKSTDETPAVQKESSTDDVIFESEKQDKDVITLEEKGKKLEKRTKKQKKNKEDYSEYLIPENGYLPVGNTGDKQISIQGSVSKTDELTLADCLELALANNPKIKAAYANVSVIKENKVQTISNYTPSLYTNTGITRTKPDTSAIEGYPSKAYTRYLLGEITLSEMVYDFGFTQNQYTINKIEWEMSKQNVESVVNSVVRDVKDAYYNLLYALSAKQVRAESVEHFEQMYNQAKAFYEIGTHPKVDVTIAAANLADARANYIQATNAVDLAVSKLNNIMGTPFIDPYVVDTSMPFQETNITMKEAIEIANKARPDLKMAISEVQIAEQSVKLSKKAYMPNLSLQADVGMGGRHDFTDKNWYSVGGYFSFPVINPVSITSKIKQAKAQLEQQKYDAKGIVNDIYYEIQTAYVSLNDARQRISASKVAVQEARESYELSQGRYKAGVCDAIELKEAQLTYDSAKLAYINNIYFYNSAKASLEKAIGQTIKDSDIQESIEI